MKKVFTLILCALLLLGSAACGEAPSEAEAPVDLQALFTEMSGKMPELIVLDETMMFNYFGLAPEYYTQALVATSADGLLTDELWLIEAADEESLEKIREMARMRLTAKAEESISYSPEQYAVVQKALCPESGLYIALIASPDVEDIAAIFTAAMN